MSTRRGHALIAVTLIGAAGIATAFVASSTISHRSVSSASFEAATEGQRIALAAAFIEPDSLAAAGVSLGAAGTVARNAFSHLENSDTTLAADYESIVSLRGRVLTAENSVRSGKGSPQELSALRTQLASFESGIAARFGTLRAAAFAGLTDAQRDRIEVLRTSDPLGLGYPYRAMDGTESERVSLRNALANVRTCAFAGESPDGACQSSVISADQRGDVTTASAGLLNLASIRNAFATGLAG